MGRPKLTATVRNAVAHRRMRCRLHDLEREASETGFGELIGNSEPMRRVYREITRLAQSEITVLVFGESGTGKELVARALHDHSGRSRARSKPQLSNLLACDAELIEDELEP